MPAWDRRPMDLRQALACLWPPPTHFHSGRREPRQWGTQALTIVGRNDMGGRVPLSLISIASKPPS